MKRAQVAMEYIITYGWALLAVMALIGGLSFFGIFEPADTLAETCSISQDIYCDDFQVILTGSNEEYVEVYVKNTNREDFIVDKVQCTIGVNHDDAIDSNFFVGEGYTAYNSSSKEGILRTNRYVKIRCGGPVPIGGDIAQRGSKIKVKLLMDMKTDSSFVHTVEGEVVARVK